MWTRMRSRTSIPSRIYYFGQSFGGIYGTTFLAVEPGVGAGVSTWAAERSARSPAWAASGRW